MASSKRLILVIGGTGAQGIAVVEGLLGPAANGSDSPFRLRILTRDIQSAQSKRLAAMEGIELFAGSVKDLNDVDAALEGAWGAFVNTDGFTIGDKEESHAGFRIFELAKMKGIKRYVYSNLDYGLKKGGYNPQYQCNHYDAKGRIAEWMGMQPSEKDGMQWTVLTTGPYMDMLFHLFAPAGTREDGTFVFIAPIGDGHIPMVALSDIGFFARYIFDNPELTSGKDLEVASDIVGWDYLVDTFTRVTGHKAVYLRQTLDEYFDLFIDADSPVAVEVRGPEAITFRKNFSGWWSLFRDDILKRDLDWVRSVNPNTVTLEDYMRKENYQGVRKPLLKGTEGNGRPTFDQGKVLKLLHHL